MKDKTKTLFYVVWSILFVLALTPAFSSCESAHAETTSTGEVYSTKGNRGDVEVLKIRDCEYVFWHNGYGSDHEHYEGCNNMQHNISVMQAQISLLEDEVKRLEEENQRMGSLLGESEMK